MAKQCCQLGSARALQMHLLLTDGAPQPDQPTTTPNQRCCAAAARCHQHSILWLQPTCCGWLLRSMWQRHSHAPCCSACSKGCSCAAAKQTQAQFPLRCSVCCPHSGKAAMQHTHTHTAKSVRQNKQGAAQHPARLPSSLQKKGWKKAPQQSVEQQPQHDRHARAPLINQNHTNVSLPVRGCARTDH